MNIKKIISEKDDQYNRDKQISFTRAQLISLTADQIQHLTDYFHGYVLMRLPEDEMAFFDWLKTADPAVWDDLWAGEEDPYLVSVDFLQRLAGEQGNFPICDLVDTENYWFNQNHIKPKGNEALIDILNLAEKGKSLKINQNFLLELSSRDIDIWHYCYQYQISVAKMKEVIEEMVYQGWIVHLPDRADLVKYIEI